MRKVVVVFFLQSEKKKAAMLPSYCITLQSEGSRWPIFITRAQGVEGIAVKRFAAIDCRENRYKRWAALIEPEARAELEIVAKTGLRDRHEQLTPGAVGCYLSHLSVMREAYRREESRVLIFEDDAVPPPNLVELLKPQLQKLDNKFPNWDLFLLGYISPQKPMLPEPVRLFKFYRLHAYVVSSRGMAKILALAYPLQKQLDTMLSEQSHRIEIYGAVPQLVTNDDTVATTIQLPLQPSSTRAPHKSKSGKSLQISPL